MSRHHGTRAKGGKRVTKTSKAAATKKSHARFVGMTDPRVIVEQILAEKDPKKRWQMEQALAMSEAVRIAKAEGEAQARRAHELGKAHPGERLGAGELVDLLMRQRGKS